MNAIKFTGTAGEVRWGYTPAATLATWELVANETGGGTVTAKVVTQDMFRVAQRPLTFVVPRPSGPAWCWPIQSLQLAGETLTASLGPQE